MQARRILFAKPQQSRTFTPSPEFSNWFSATYVKELSTEQKNNTDEWCPSSKIPSKQNKMRTCIPERERERQRRRKSHLCLQGNLYYCCVLSSDVIYQGTQKKILGGIRNFLNCHEKKIQAYLIVQLTLSPLKYSPWEAVH